jgi:dUTP pyrophosphatase
MKVFFKKVTEWAKIPSFARGDTQNAGLDLYADSIIEDGKKIDAQSHLRMIPAALAMIPPGQRRVFGIGVAWEAESRRGYKPAMMITARSGMTSLGVIALEGLIDAGYRGEIKVILENRGTSSVIIHYGDRIAQGVIVLVPDIEVVETDTLSGTERGDSGFGSTGR